MKLPLGFWILLMTFWSAATSVSAAAASRPISLWSGNPPAETNAVPAEADTTKPGDALVAGRRVIRLENVSDPTITIYQPDPAKPDVTSWPDRVADWMKASGWLKAAK